MDFHCKLAFIKKISKVIFDTCLNTSEHAQVYKKSVHYYNNKIYVQRFVLSELHMNGIESISKHYYTEDFYYLTHVSKEVVFVVSLLMSFVSSSLKLIIYCHVLKNSVKQARLSHSSRAFFRMTSYSLLRFIIIEI